MVLEAEGDKATGMAAMLAASGILFGEPGVLGERLPARPGRVVLGWLAQGYAQRHRLRNPAGLVFRRLEQGKMPVRCYLEAPEKYLPREYLAAIGRLSIAPSCSAVHRV